jgi:hypothetical protein
MAQRIIDPNNRGKPTGQKRVVQLPPEARDHKFVPDFERCKPGDLILSRSVEPTFIEAEIVKFHDRAGFGPADSCWTHAAVFLYEDFVVEADKDGVRTRTLYNDIPGSLLRVRRRPGLSIGDRYKIALCAQRMLGMRYDLKGAVQLGLEAKKSKMWDREPNMPEVKDAVICSEVFYDAHRQITRTLLADCPDVGVTPAHLSATADLEDVFVPWLELT